MSSLPPSHHPLRTLLSWETLISHMVIGVVARAPRVLLWLRGDMVRALNGLTSSHFLVQQVEYPTHKDGGKYVESNFHP